MRCTKNSFYNIFIVISVLLVALFGTSACGMLTTHNVSPVPGAASAAPMQEVAKAKSDYSPLAAVESERANAVPVDHRFARELQAEACIARMLEVTHEVDRTAGLSRATDTCHAVWLSHERQVSDWRMVHDYALEHESTTPGQVPVYRGEFLITDFPSLQQTSE